MCGSTTAPIKFFNIKIGNSRKIRDTQYFQIFWKNFYNSFWKWALCFHPNMNLFAYVDFTFTTI